MLQDLGFLSIIFEQIFMPLKMKAQVYGLAWAGIRSKREEDWILFAHLAV